MNSPGTPAASGGGIPKGGYRHGCGAYAGHVGGADVGYQLACCCASMIVLTLRKKFMPL